MTGPFKAYAALALTMCFWGASSSFIRSQALAITPQNSLSLRYSFMAIIALVGLIATRQWRIARGDWLRLGFAGIAGMAGYNLLVNYGLQSIAVGAASVIIAVEPLLIALGAWLFLREGFSPYLAAGLGFAMAGSIALFWNHAGGASGNPVSLLGASLIFLSCTAWAIYTIAMKPLLARYPAFQVTAWTMLIAAPPIILNGTQTPLRTALQLDARQWFEQVWLIVPNGILGTLLWNYGAARVPGATAGAFLYLIPVIAIFCGALILGETVTPNVIIGCLLTLLGVALAQFGPRLAARRA